MNEVGNYPKTNPCATGSNGDAHCRILLVSHCISNSGAPHSLLRHAKYMLDAGHKVDVVSIDYYNDASFDWAYSEAGLTPIHIGNSYEAFVRWLDGSCVQYNLAVCNTVCTYKCAAVLQQRGVPTVWFIREVWLLDNWFVYFPWFARVLKNFYNIYAPSDYAAHAISKFNRRVRVLNNSVQDRFHAYGPIQSKIRFGFLGTINPMKGVAGLIKAYGECVKSGLDVELKIAGKIKGCFAENLVDKTQELTGLKWLGAVSDKDKAEFFNTIDVLCLPSYSDSSGLSVMEGAMYGKIIITTSRTGAKYMVDSASGAIVEPGSVSGLSEAMKRIAQLSKDELRSMQEHSRALYLKFGTSDRERNDVLKMVAENIVNIPCKAVPYYVEEGRPSLAIRAVRKARRILWSHYLWLLGRGPLVRCPDEKLFQD